MRDLKTKIIGSALLLIGLTSFIYAGGYKVIERYDYSPRQTVVAVIKCDSNGRKVKVRYYPNNGSRPYNIGGGYGSSLDEVSSKFCSN